MILKKVWCALLVGLTFLLTFTPSAVFASAHACDDYPPNAPYYKELCEQGNANDLTETIKRVLNVVFGLVAIMAVVMIVVGGVKYSTSAGDPQKVQSAKNTILYSVIGLIITLSAFAITNFVLGAIN